MGGVPSLSVVGLGGGVGCVVAIEGSGGQEKVAVLRRNESNFVTKNY